MTPFEKHNINHLSASSLGLFRSQPALWCLKYLVGFKDIMGAAAWRGSAVEAGLSHFLYKGDLQGALSAANTRFELEAQGEIAADLDAERANLEPMLGQAIQAFGKLGVPTAYQLKIEARFDGLSVPVIGYFDFLFDGRIDDLKTTKACPSEAKSDHSRQVSLYVHARNYKEKGFLTYVTAKKSATYEVTNIEQHVSEVRRDALALQSFLDRVRDGRDAVGMLAADTDHFMWSDEAKSALLKAA